MSETTPSAAIPPAPPPVGQYRYEGQDHAGGVLRGTLEAAGAADAEARLAAIGLRAVAVDPVPVA